MNKSTAFTLSQKQAFHVTDTGQPLGGLGLTIPGIPKIPSVADIQKFISDTGKTVNNYNIVGRKLAAVQAKINALRTPAARLALNQKIGSARAKYNIVAASIEKIKGGLGLANSVLAQVRSAVAGRRSGLGFIQIGQIVGIITATTILVAVAGTIITINRYLDNLNQEAQRQLDLERQQQEANYCASYPNDPRCGGGAPPAPDYAAQIQQQYYQQYQPPTGYYPPVRQPTYEQYYVPQQPQYPEQQYYAPQAQTYYTIPPESYQPQGGDYLNIDQEFGLFGMESSDDQNRLWRRRRGLEGERDHRFDDILDIFPGIEGLDARDQRWDNPKVNKHMDHRNMPGIFGLGARDQRWDVRKHVPHTDKPGIFGFGGQKDYRHDKLKQAGLANKGCGKIACLLKEVGL